MSFRTLNDLLGPFLRRPQTARATGERLVTTSRNQVDDRVEDPDGRTTLPGSTVGESEQGTASQQRTSQPITSQSRRRQCRHGAEGDEAIQGTEQAQILSRDREFPIPLAADNPPEFPIPLVAADDPPEVAYGRESEVIRPALDQPDPEVFRPALEPVSPVLPADGPRWIPDLSSDEDSIASSQSSLRGSRGPIRAPQSKIPGSQNLRFCFVADGTALLIWQGEGASCIVRICLPFGKDPMRGQKLTLASRRRGSMSSEMRVVFVAAGSKIVAAVVAQGSRFKLLVFDKEGRHDPQHDSVERDCGQNPPLSLSVSRDDRRIAVGWGGVVEIYSVVNGGLDQTPMRAIEPPIVGQLHLQITNFSVDSTELIIASQATGKHSHRPDVHTSVHKISEDTLPTLQRIDAPKPCQLQAVSSRCSILSFRVQCNH
jgi:hypothetical protein